MPTVAVENARQEWQEGSRRLQRERDAVQRERVLAQVEAVTQELRRRVGQTFTLGELADAYFASDAWVQEVLAEQAVSPDWPRTVTTAAEAAFHLYARGAIDYRP